VKELTESRVTSSSLKDVLQVTPSVVKEAVKKLKPGKSDPVFSFSSDCFKHCPDSLYSILSTVLQGFMIHGHVTQILLLATLVPIIKDNMASHNISKNYRSIAISSLILKQLDWVFIILHKKNLRS
jgi:hypothetical protein